MTEINSRNDLVGSDSDEGKRVEVLVAGLAERRGDRAGQVNRLCVDDVVFSRGGSQSGGGAEHRQEVVISYVV